MEKNSINLGNYLRNTGTAILCLLIPIVNIVILIWLLILLFQVVDAAKKLGAERGSKELNDFANLYLLSFFIGLVVVIAGTSIIVSKVLSINWYGLGYSNMYLAMMDMMNTVFLVSMLGIIVSIMDILAWKKMREFFERGLETGFSKQKGLDGANYGFIGSILGLIPIISIVGLILLIMGYFTTGSAFLLLNSGPAPAMSGTGYIAPPSAIPPTAFVSNIAPINPNDNSNLRPGQAQSIPPSSSLNPGSPGKAIHCRYCGVLLPQNEDVRFCPGCGAAL